MEALGESRQRCNKRANSDDRMKKWADKKGLS
jgi:hypothetical protein